MVVSAPFPKDPGGYSRASVTACSDAATALFASLFGGAASGASTEEPIAGIGAGAVLM